MKGIIDEVRLYNYARSASQIAYDYNRGVPVGWWKFDECQGSTAYDNSTTGSGAAGGKNGIITIGSTGTNNKTGSCTGNSTDAWYNGATGKFSSSLDLDGTDDVVTVLNASAIDLNDGLQNGFTISAWVYPGSVGEGSAGQIFQKGTGNYCQLGGSSPFNIICNVALATANATLTVNSILPVSTWSHIALTWNNDSDDEITLWVNGAGRGVSGDGNGNTAADTADILIGGASGNNFDGQVDDLRLFNYEMSEMQIKTLANEGFSQRFGPQTGSP